MLNSRWKSSRWTNMYVAGCHAQRSVSSADGVSPSAMVNAGNSAHTRNTATFAMISHLTAGEIPPGPNE